MTENPPQIHPWNAPWLPQAPMGPKFPKCPYRPSPGIWGLVQLTKQSLLLSRLRGSDGGRLIRGSSVTGEIGDDFLSLGNTNSCVKSKVFIDECTTWKIFERNWLDIHEVNFYF